MRSEQALPCAVAQSTHPLGIAPLHFCRPHPATDRPRLNPVLVIVDFGPAGGAAWGCLMKIIRLFAVALAAASLAACAQSSRVSERSAPHPTRQASFAPAVVRHVAVTPKPVSIVRRDPTEAKTASSGLASFYTEGTRTAS